MLFREKKKNYVKGNDLSEFDIRKYLPLTNLDDIFQRPLHNLCASHNARESAYLMQGKKTLLIGQNGDQKLAIHDGSQKRFSHQNI